MSRRSLGNVLQFRLAVSRGSFGNVLQFRLALSRGSLGNVSHLNLLYLEGLLEMSSSSDLPCLEVLWEMSSSLDLPCLEGVFPSWTLLLFKESALKLTLPDPCSFERKLRHSQSLLPAHFLESSFLTCISVPASLEPCCPVEI